MQKCGTFFFPLFLGSYLKCLMHIQLLPFVFFPNYPTACPAHCCHMKLVLPKRYLSSHVRSSSVHMVTEGEGLSPPLVHPAFRDGSDTPPSSFPSGKHCGFPPPCPFISLTPDLLLLKGAGSPWEGERCYGFRKPK